jgi:ribosomal protein S4E
MDVNVCMYYNNVAFLIVRITQAPRPSTGPHKLRECLPLTLVLRNRLKYALTRQEVVQIVMRRLVKVDHKIRTDITYPAGFMGTHISTLLHSEISSTINVIQ